MKLTLGIVAAIVTLGSTSTFVEAKGCVKGAVVGGVAGHVAGHHGVAGAAIGCAVGHHQAKVKAKEKAAQERAAAANTTPGANVRQRGDEVRDVRTQRP